MVHHPITINKYNDAILNTRDTNRTNTDRIENDNHITMTEKDYAKRLSLDKIHANFDNNINSPDHAQTERNSKDRRISFNQFKSQEERDRDVIYMTNNIILLTN